MHGDDGPSRCYWTALSALTSQSMLPQSASWAPASPASFCRGRRFSQGRRPRPNKVAARKLGRASRSRSRAHGAREKERGEKKTTTTPFRSTALTDRGGGIRSGGDGEGAVVVGGVAAPSVPRACQDPRRRPPGDVLGPPVRAQGLPPGRRRRPRGAAAADAPGVALRAQRSLPGLLSPGTRPFANSLPPIIFASIFLGIFLLRR